MTHQELRASAAAYALGALDGAELAAFEAHLEACAECRVEVDAHREVAGLLAYAAPSVQPRAGASLRDRIMADAAQARPIRSARPAAASVAPLRAAGRTRASRVGWLAAAACLTIAVVSGVAYRNTSAENERLVQSLGATRRDAESTRVALAARDSTLSAFFGPMVHVVSLSEGGGREPSARVFWNHTKNVFVVTAFNVPQAPKGRVYQLWAMRNGKAPLSMGTFTPDPSGRALAV
ncbi:MAG: anti-sigma factor, partial [Gemmatimonadaceae bacterium]